MIPPTDLPHLTIYSDGACNPNPGPGGWGAVLLAPDSDPVELSGRDPNTTNNRMELTAAIKALDSLTSPHKITLYTDSKYLKRGVTEWISVWERRNWKTIDNTDVLNQDLWVKLRSLLQKHEITWKWVKGHNDDKWNERADSLAGSAIVRQGLPLDDNNAIHIFTGVTYSVKTRTGGWGVLLRYRNNRKILTGQKDGTTGNRMHIQAAIEGLTAIKRPLPIHFYTVSSYLRDGATGWVRQWSMADWKTKEGKKVSHRDLWHMLADIQQRYRLNWHITSKKHPPCEMQEIKILAREKASSDEN